MCRVQQQLYGVRTPPPTGALRPKRPIHKGAAVDDHCRAFGNKSAFPNDQSEGKKPGHLTMAIETTGGEFSGLFPRCIGTNLH